MTLFDLKKPRAITMWDFSWLERRWPGAGYEDWDFALDELVERGYDAIRIDAYPHLVSWGAEREWTIVPAWNQHDWGSPAKTRISIQPNLNLFLKKCRDRGIVVGLSSWFQKVEERDLKTVLSAKHHADIWKQTLDSIAAEGLLDTILYLDFCNEWPFTSWAPFFRPREQSNGRWTDPDSIRWMIDSVQEIRKTYPDMAYTYSYVGLMGYEQDQIEDIRLANDFIEPHLWMVHANGDDFYGRLDYRYPRFDSSGYESVVEHAETIYRADPEYWKASLEQHIDRSVAESIELDRPMITTECWGLVEYKDWPLLDWDWVKDICAHGVRYSSSKGRWLANATSNFCGPQFVGMWRDVDWHRELTDLIKSAPMPDGVKGAK